jgi:hypothetical protein
MQGFNGSLTIHMYNTDLNSIGLILLDGCRRSGALSLWVTIKNNKNDV